MPDLPSSDAHLILEEHVVGLVHDFLHVDDRADAWDLHVSQHGEHQDGLHQQLPVLGLRDTVQHRLHVDGELDLSRRHLEGNQRWKNTGNLLLRRAFTYQILLSIGKK